jgi:hypothetical protein
MFDAAGQDQAAMRARVASALLKRGVEVVPGSEVAERVYGLKGLQCGPDLVAPEKTLLLADGLVAQGKAKDGVLHLATVIDGLEESWEPTDAQLALLRKARAKAATILLSTGKAPADDVARSDGPEGKAAREYLKAILRTSPMFALGAKEYPPSARLALDYARLEMEKEPQHRVTVTSDIPGLEVMVEGQVAGITPLQHSLPAGTYRVWTRLGARRSTTRFVTLPKDIRVHFDFASEPLMTMCAQQHQGLAADLNEQMFARLAGPLAADVLVVRTSRRPFVAGAERADFQVANARSSQAGMAAMARVDVFDFATGVVARRAEMVEQPAVDVAEELVAFALGERVPTNSFRPEEPPSPLAPDSACDGCGMLELVPGEVPAARRQVLLSRAHLAFAVLGFGTVLPLHSGASARALWEAEQCGQHPEGWRRHLGGAGMMAWEDYPMLQDCVDTTALRAAAGAAHWLGQIHATGNKDPLVVFTPRDAKEAALSLPVMLSLPAALLEEPDAPRLPAHVHGRLVASGQLQVLSAVEGVELRLDGMPLNKVTAQNNWGRTMGGLAPGTHVLEALFPGFTRATVKVLINDDKRAVVTLRAQNGQVVSDVTERLATWND